MLKLKLTFPNLYLVFVTSCCFSFLGFAQQPNDCVNAVVVCGSSSFSFDVNGGGIEEVNGKNTCGGSENNSIWLEINIATSGTLAFTLTPASSDINEDYDFFLYGPDVSCSNIGQAVRCSTTNPAAANQGNNLTGMKDTNPPDPTEGPGPDGDSFVQQLDVLAGESYFLVIDRPIGNSAFSLEWTGTAEFPESPSNPLVADASITQLPNLELCDDTAPFDDNITQIDLRLLRQDIINGASDVRVSFHRSESDANINVNRLGDVFNNSFAIQGIFIRIENTTTGCFILNSFTVIVDALTAFNPPSDYGICDTITDDGDDNNGQTTFNFATKTDEMKDGFTGVDYDISYHLSQNAAESNRAAMPLIYYNTTPTPIKIFVRIEDNSLGCLGFTSFDIEVLENPVANNLSIVQCDEDGNPNGLTTYDLTDYTDEITGGAADRTVSFYKLRAELDTGQNEIEADAFNNNVSPQTLFALVTNTQTSCNSIAEITLETSLTASNDSALTVCDDDGTEDGFYSFDLTDAKNDILLGLPAGLDVDYYETYDDALTEDNPLPTIYTNTVPNSQTIFARVENANACFGISSIELTVFKLPQLVVQEDIFYCLNTFPQTITIDGGIIDDNPNNYVYDWSNGETTPSIEVNIPGVYSVIVTSTDGCIKNRTVNVLPSNIATFTNIEITDATSNNTISVFVSGEGTYQFALDDPSGPYQDSSVFENVNIGFHTVYVRDIKNDCGIVEEFVSVIGFPKYFTPNGDGFNQYWQVQGISEEFQAGTKILIFDRYGKLIKELNPLGQGWDGTFNGSPMPTSDYWFVVNLQDGRTFKGHFTLKR